MPPKPFFCDAYMYLYTCTLKVFDVTRKLTYKNLHHWYSEMREHRPDIPCILVANKIDGETMWYLLLSASARGSRLWTRLSGSACLCVHLYMYVYTCMCVCTCMCVYTCMCVCTCMCVYTCMCVCTCMRPCTCVYIYTCTNSITYTFKMQVVYVVFMYMSCVHISTPLPSKG